MLRGAALATFMMTTTTAFFSCDAPSPRTRGSTLHVRPAAWFPTTEGWTGKIKPFWFGANRTGLDSVATLALMAKHSVVGYGWQTGGAVENGVASVGRGDSWGSTAVTHAADYMRSHGHNNVTLFQYREIQIAIRLYAQNAIAADNPANDPFWLHNDSGICLATAAWGTSDPFWNFSNPDATAYWLNNVIGELTTDDSLTNNAPFAAVFFDEVDREYCGYSGSHTRHCNFAKFNNLQQQTDSIAMLPQVRTELAFHYHFAFTLIDSLALYAFACARW